MASQETLYLKLERNVEIEKEDVQLSDLGKLVCANKDILAHAKAMKIYKFRDTKPLRQVVSVMKIIESLQKLYPELTVENLGETDIIMERVRVKREKGPAQWLKIAFVCLICFFGTAFTIMAFHNDIGINKVFSGRSVRRLYHTGGGILHRACHWDYRILQPYRREADYKGPHAYRGGNAHI